jgi:hypothetical protein
MQFEVRADAGVVVTIRLFQGEFQFGNSIIATESSNLQGFYTAPYPSGLAAGKYRVEVTAGDTQLTPYSLWWSGSVEINIFTIYQQLAAISTKLGGMNSGLTVAQIELLNEIHRFSEIAKQGVIGRYVTSPLSNSATLYEGDNTTPIVVFDLADENGIPSTKGVCSRTPR